MIIKFFKKLMVKRSIFLLNIKMEALRKDMREDEKNCCLSWNSPESYKLQEQIVVKHLLINACDEEMDYLNQKLVNLLNNV